MKPRNIIVIVGESGSGKTTLADVLDCTVRIVHDHYKRYEYSFKKVVTTTTRPKRDGENFEDYTFVSKDYFKNNLNDFVEYSEYNSWLYGVKLDDILDALYMPYTTSYGLETTIPVIIMTPKGLRTLKRVLKKKYGDEYTVTSFYLKVDRKSRLKKLIDTRDDIDESIRRNISDVGMFDGIEDEVDYVLDNEEYKKPVYKLCDELMNHVMDKQ
jgi:guanylate kinase